MVNGAPYCCPSIKYEFSQLWMASRCLIAFLLYFTLIFSTAQSTSFAGHDTRRWRRGVYVRSHPNDRIAKNRFITEARFPPLRALLIVLRRGFKRLGLESAICKSKPISHSINRWPKYVPKYIRFGVAHIATLSPERFIASAMHDNFEEPNCIINIISMWPYSSFA